ncbi:MAG TPA: hypothetical protein VGI39_17545, partial [Polyangiaceae bacterium]
MKRFVAVASLASGLSCAPAASPPPPSAPAHPAPAPTTPAATATLAMHEDQMREVIEPLAEPPRVNVVLEHATVLTATGARFDPGYVVMADGHITAVGAGEAPRDLGASVTHLEARGKFVTPGIIDVHSHMGVYPVPATGAHDDGNELTDPVTAGVRAEDSFWPQDPSIERAVAGGVTTIAVLPGSGNLVGGRGVVLDLIPHRGARAMRFPGAPEIVKMACGENPKRVYHDQKRAPQTRMANLRAVREAFLKAQKYAREWDEYAKHGGKAEDGGAAKL